jgi:nucleoside-diphosphate-sugar epimerase
VSVHRTSAGAILVTGGNGFLGSLVVATALMESDDTIVLPLREPYTRERVLAPIVAELAAEGRPAAAEDLARVVILPLPACDRIDELLPALRDLRVREILHCAGSLSYFNVRKLQAGNLDLTRAVLSLGTALDLRRFVYVSTAYSAGFTDRPILETLHDEPRNDPTDYTRTKREAEWMVARSGLPYVIVRPSIVIGDSRDGRYGGKPYGPYQLWSAGGRYLSNGFPRVLHVVAGDKPVNFLHQDAFKEGFWAAYRTLPDGAVLHLVSRDDALPTMRDLWELWLSVHGGPREVHFFDRLDDVPMDEVAPEVRLWLDFTAVNNEIGSARWNFRRDRLEGLRRSGLEMTDASLATIAVAQRRFVADSPRLQRFIRRYRAEGTAAPRFVEHIGEPARSATVRAS